MPGMKKDRHSQPDGEKKCDKRTCGNDLAMGEIGNPAGFVDKHQSQGGQGIDGPHHNPTDYNLKK